MCLTLLLARLALIHTLNLEGSQVSGVVLLSPSLSLHGKAFIIVTADLLLLSLSPTVIKLKA